MRTRRGPIQTRDSRNAVIQLTRLRHGDAMYLNPDLFERVDTHVDTVVRLTDGTEYVVIEPAEEIVRRIVEMRARIIALAGMMQSGAAMWSSPPPTGPPDDDQPRELTTPDQPMEPVRVDGEHAS